MVVDTDAVNSARGLPANEHHHPPAFAEDGSMQTESDICQWPISYPIDPQLVVGNRKLGPKLCWTRPFAIISRSAKSAIGSCPAPQSRDSAEVKPRGALFSTIASRTSPLVINSSGFNGDVQASIARHVTRTVAHSERRAIPMHSLCFYSRTIQALPNYRSCRRI